jgi:hypothetical protein
VRRGVDGRVGITGLLDHRRRHVAGNVVVDQVRSLACDVDPHHGRQQLVVDDHALRRVLGEVAVLGDHHHDRLADVVHLDVGEWVRRTPMGQRGMRDEQRQRLPHSAVEVVVGVDRHQPVDVERVGDVDVADPGMRVRAAHEGDLERVVAEVVEIATLTGEQTRVLTSLDRLPEHLRGHGAPRSGLSASSPARSTAATMFW